jgi:hypothetical protein
MLTSLLKVDCWRLTYGWSITHFLDTSNETRENQDAYGLHPVSMHPRACCKKRTSVLQFEPASTIRGPSIDFGNLRLGPRN